MKAQSSKNLQMKKYFSYKILQEIFSRLELRLKILYINYLYSIFNKVVKNQLKDYKTIPIIIVNYNQLKNLKLLINYLLINDYKNITIIDNSSTYNPLLSYYETINKTVSVIRFKKNYGHMVFWNQAEIFKKFSNGYYVVTDPDILPINECPDDFLKKFLELLKSSRKLYKVGFSLKIDDIPDFYLNKSTVLKWESMFWKNKNKNGDFIADIDTTFALYRPKLNFRKYFYKGLRTNYPYQARHLGWYIDSNNLTEEEFFYRETANSSNSWKF